ncbi:MAG: hypothetical protein AAFO91_14150, partial [Bacteroidota bacterium]
MSSTEQTYYLYARDISGVRNNGTPIYAEAGAEKTGYELSSWLVIGADAILLQPEEEQTIPITINVPENESPGSHFG